MLNFCNSIYYLYTYYPLFNPIYIEFLNVFNYLKNINDVYLLLLLSIYLTILHLRKKKKNKKEIFVASLSVNLLLSFVLLNILLNHIKSCTYLI